MESTASGAIPAVGASAGDVDGSAPAVEHSHGHSGQQASLGDAQAAAILNAVEQQLTRYFDAMTQRAHTAQQSGDASRDQLVDHFQQQIDALKGEFDHSQQAGEAGRNALIGHFQQQLSVLNAELERSKQANEGYERALQEAIEERLTEFADSQNWRFGEVEGRLARVTEEISLGLPTQMEAATVPMQQRFDRTSELFANRIEELQIAARRFDEQSAALVQHVNDTSSALSRRIDENGQTFSDQLDERTNSLSLRVDEAMGGMRQHVAEQVTTFGRKLEDTENRVIDRALAMEERLNEQTGVRLAGLEATVGRISNGIDDAIVELSRRVIDLENSNSVLGERIDEITVKIESVDPDEVNQLREQMSTAVGESMLVRIELERVASSTGEQFDTFNVRLAELASDIAESTLDVGTAVQLERLEEIERALVELDPDQFVRKSDDADSSSNSGSDTDSSDTGNSDTGTGYNGTVDNGTVDNGTVDTGTVDTGTVDISADTGTGGTGGSDSTAAVDTELVNSSATADGNPSELKLLS